MFESGGIGQVALVLGGGAALFLLGKASEKAGLQMGREDVCAQLSWLCDQAEKRGLASPTEIQAVRDDVKRVSNGEDAMNVTRPGMLDMVRGWFTRSKTDAATPATPADDGPKVFGPV